MPLAAEDAILMALPSLLAPQEYASDTGLTADVAALIGRPDVARTIQGSMAMLQDRQDRQLRSQMKLAEMLQGVEQAALQRELAREGLAEQRYRTDVGARTATAGQEIEALANLLAHRRGMGSLSLQAEQLGMQAGGQQFDQVLRSLQEQRQQRQFEMLQPLLAQDRLNKQMEAQGRLMQGLGMAGRGLGYGGLNMSPEDAHGLLRGVLGGGQAPSPSAPPAPQDSPSGVGIDWTSVLLALASLYGIKKFRDWRRRSAASAEKKALSASEPHLSAPQTPTGGSDASFDSFLGPQFDPRNPGVNPMQLADDEIVAQLQRRLAPQVGVQLHVSPPNVTMDDIAAMLRPPPVGGSAFVSSPTEAFSVSTENPTMADALVAMLRARGTPPPREYPWSYMKEAIKGSP